MAASEEGHDEVVRVLLDAGADVDASEEKGRRALYYGVGRGHIDGSCSSSPAAPTMPRAMARPPLRLVLSAILRKDKNGKSARPSSRRCRPAPRASKPRTRTSRRGSRAGG